MKTFKHLNRIILAAACGAIAFHTTLLNASGLPGSIALIQANAGVTAVLTPVSGLTFTATAGGPVQTSLLGNCVEAVTLTVQFPATPDQPVLLNGTGSFTALNGTNSLNFTTTGTATPDPANPFFYNAKYQVTFTGGTGAYASAKGLAEITELVMFTSASTGTATWTLKGFVTTSR